MKPSVPFPIILFIIISWYNIVCSVEVNKTLNVKTANAVGIERN